MLFDPRVNGFDIQYDVENGRVTLRGIVYNLIAKKVAEKLAINIAGVKSVTNRIKVRPLSRPPDKKIISNIKAALIINPFTERLNINIRVKDGNVILSGEADSVFEKAEVENVANKIRGVTKVENRLKALSLVISDKEIEDRIKLFLTGSATVDEDQIEVTVVNGIAILTGAVNSWPEHYAVTDIAYKGGSVSVVNKLKVK